MHPGEGPSGYGRTPVRRHTESIFVSTVITLGALLFGAVVFGNTSAANGSEMLGQKYGPDPRQRMDLFTAESSKAGSERGAKRKVVLYFHGGGWRWGDTWQHRFVGRALAARGYLAAVSTYRLYPQVKFPQFMHDAARAVAWLRDRAPSLGGDPDRLYLMGHSAGAHIAVLVALDPRYLRQAKVPRRAIAGVVGLAGPYVFNPRGWHSFGPVFTAHPNPSARPVDFAGSVRTLGGPRLLLLQGGQDRLVKVREGLGLARAYRAAGGKAQVKTYPDLGHVGVLFAINKAQRWRAPVLQDIFAFIGKP